MKTLCLFSALWVGVLASPSSFGLPSNAEEMESCVRQQIESHIQKPLPEFRLFLRQRPLHDLHSVILLSSQWISSFELIVDNDPRDIPAFVRMDSLQLWYHPTQSPEPAGLASLYGIEISPEGDLETDPRQVTVYARIGDESREVVDLTSCVF